MKQFFVALSFLCLWLVASGSPKREKVSIELSQSDTLYIQFIDMIDYRGGSQNDRFWHFETTLEKILEEVDFPMEYKIVRFGANSTPPGHPRLDVTLTMWGFDGLSELEVRLSASLRHDYNRNPLGTFYERGGGLFATGEQMTRAYNEVLGKALVRVVAELNARIPIGEPVAAGEGEEEEGSGN